MMLGKLNTVLLECKDLKKSEEFYVTKLGLKKTDSGDGWLCVDGGGVSIVMWQGPNPSVTLGFTGADLPAVAKEMPSRGVSVSALMQHPGGQHYDLKDPDGNTVMVADQ